MPRYRFSWDQFDDRVVEALADLVGYASEARGVDRRAWLAAAVKRPTEDFVGKAKQVLERTWLLKYAGAGQIVNRLQECGIGPGGRPTSQNGYVDFIRKCRNSGTVRHLLCEHLRMYGDQDRRTDEDVAADPLGLMPRNLATITVEKQPPDDRNPHPYQRDAWKALSRELPDGHATGVFEGLLVMPTGSGKTFTAVRWLVDEHINRGGRVVWVAHRHELLEQAAVAFYRAASRMETMENGQVRERVRVRIVSGMHSSVTQIGPADDVVICSISSLSRRAVFYEELLSDPRVFLVIDEAHHAPAKSYRKLIKFLQGCSSRRVLGLTATPTRTVERERSDLVQLFGGNRIFEVQTRELIEQSYLARPIPVHVKTTANVEDEITEEDIVHLEKFDELSEAWLDRIAHMTKRNELIVKHYMKKENREKYAKTLVFAINVAHAKLLAERFQLEGVEADYVASYRPGKSVDKTDDDDEADKTNKGILERFRDKNSGLDILINVQMLTEGVDIPNIQTVFLTRPTNSEILLRQMIGRGLRGLKANGTKEAYLVSFEDHWERFPNWENPFDLVVDIFDPVEQDLPPKPGETEPKQLLAIPWDLIKDTAAALRRLMADNPIAVFEAVPDGWYVLGRELEGVSVRQIVSVYEHQQPCWAHFIEELHHLAQHHQEALQALRKENAFNEWFYDCDVPVPSIHQVGEMIEHFRAGGEKPEYHPFQTRKESDPYEIANEIALSNLAWGDVLKLIQQRHATPLAQAVYPDFLRFHQAVQTALLEKQFPTRIPQGIPIFEPPSDPEMAPGPTHDLDTLLAETLSEAVRLLDHSHLPVQDIKMEWSRRLIKGWFARAYWEPANAKGTGRIRVNRLLDSPDFTGKSLRFLLWHEFLHLYLQEGHTKLFRDWERKWPGYTEAERELDTLKERFNVQYW